MNKNNKQVLLALAAVLFAGAAFASHAEVPPYPNFGLPRTEEMMFLVIQIGVIIFAAKLGGMLAQKIKLPSILGELAAGIVIGPWALGGIGFGSGMFAEGLFHGGALRALAAGGQAFDATSPALYGIATLASIILLFLSGLETNLKMFLKYSFVGSMVGVGGVVVSFLFGDVCAVAFLPRFFPAFAELAQMPFASAMTQAAPLYMGIMSTATSVGITARILSEKKKMDSEEGTTIMAGAVIDDVLGLIVLAIGNGIIATNLAAAQNGGVAGGMDWGNIGLVAAKAFGVWLGATLIGVMAARYIARFLKVSFKSPVVIATMAFGLSMVLAGFFEYMGLAMIIGAYVMGLALSRTDLKHTIQESLDPVYTFLVPIFFCVMGMMVDVTQLCSVPVLAFGAIYTILAVAAKVLGCMVPSMFCGFNLLGGLRIGAGMVPRGEVALIIAGIGLSAGFLTQEIFGIGIMMTLITTVVAPPALVALFAPKAKGARHPNPTTSDSREVAFELSSPEVADYVLTKLVAEFRTEGFFTSLLSKEENIWEIVMDDMELSIRRHGNKILAQCTEPEEAVLMTAWMEVASQVSDLAKSISQPMRSDAMGRLLKDTQRTGIRRTSVRNVLRYVQGFVMLPGFTAKNKADAIRKIVAAIAKENPNHVKDVEAATQAVLRREASMPTGLDHGIAVPHGRDASITSIVGAVAILENDGTPGSSLDDYETIDKSPVRIIVLTIANDQGQTPYLQLMSAISRVLRTDEGYAMLAACKSEEGMRRFFRGAQQG